MRARKIKMHTDQKRMVIDGWYCGKASYLWIGNDGAIDTISDMKLYRFAKTIVKEFENDLP